jgi:heme-degrading monooxygenase HmoA
LADFDCFSTSSDRCDPRHPAREKATTEIVMIARHWRGWTKVGNADDYESLLESKVLPELKKIEGYRGGYILRNDGPTESEFVVINLFDSLDAVRRFAGEDYAVPVFEPEARHLLSKVEPIAAHYEVRVNTVSVLDR